MIFSSLEPTTPCVTPGCWGTAPDNYAFCMACAIKICTPNQEVHNLPPTMSSKYPKYYKDVSDLNEIDVYEVHNRFGIDDPSGCIHHSSKKLLLSGVRTGGKSKYDDIKEARDTLNRWLQINEPK